MTVKLNDKFLSNITGKYILNVVEIKNKNFFVVVPEGTEKRMLCTNKNNFLKICTSMSAEEDRKLYRFKETK